MAFMRPIYNRDPFHVGENQYGERIAIPADVYGTIERFAEETETTDCETITGKYWAQLSASGYLDCTGWDGPHATLEQARASISELYDVDPDSGGDIDEEMDLAGDEDGETDPAGEANGET